MKSEVSSKMNIPSVINVGFQDRQDTYTKKLAYVIYTDAKGVLRKQASWDSWRDKKIKPLEFKNEPMSGFVLNKKVGGHKSSWNFRNAYVRIYDPRDFEFEISVENLLYILQETSAIKGKGLEGEFVYAWHGKDLVLLPVDTDEYKACTNFTKKQVQKVTKAEIKEGYSYLMKDMTNVMYLGKLPYCETKGYGDNMVYLPVGNHHIFLNLDSGGYIPLAGYTKLAEVTSTDTSEYANKFTAYKRSPYHKIPTGIEIIPRKFKEEDFAKKSTYSNYPWAYCLTKVGEDYCPTILYRQEDRKYNPTTGGYFPSTFSFKKWIGPASKFEFDGYSCELPKFDTYSYRGNSWGYSAREGVTVTDDEIFNGEFYTLELVSNKGRDNLLMNGFR
jgi:hypothetical protein